MSQQESPLLDRERIAGAFSLLGDRLARSGVVADIYVIGGAAMALAYDARRATRTLMRFSIPMEWCSRRRRKSPTSLACQDGGSTNRPVPTSRQVATTRRHAYSIIRVCGFSLRRPSTCWP